MRKSLVTVLFMLAFGSALGAGAIVLYAQGRTGDEVHASCPGAAPVAGQKCLPAPGGAPTRNKACNNPNANCSQANGPCGGTCKIGSPRTQREFAVVSCNDFFETTYDECAVTPQYPTVTCGKTAGHDQKCLSYTAFTTGNCTDPTMSCPGGYYFCACP